MLVKNFGVSFSIISVITGTASLFKYGLVRPTRYNPCIYPIDHRLTVYRRTGGNGLGLGHRLYDEHFHSSVNLISKIIHSIRNTDRWLCHGRFVYHQILM